MRIEFDDSDFQRQLGKALQQVEKDARDVIHTTIQGVLDAVYESHNGLPLPEVKVALRTEFEKHEIKVDDQDLEYYAGPMVAGQRPRLTLVDG